MDLQEIRDFVRDVPDVDADELPDSILDVFIRRGYKQIISLERRWPFFEVHDATLWTADGTHSYPYTSVVDADGASVPIRDVDSIEGERYPLTHVDPIDARKRWRRHVETKREPTHFSVQSTTIRLWPTPDSAYELLVGGYRNPTDWSADAGGEPDCPDVFHEPIAIFALHLAYLQQEDPEMGAFWKAQFDEAVGSARRDVMGAPPRGPIVMNRPKPTQTLDRLLFPWEA